MSTLHHDVSWPGIKAGLTTEVVNERRFYKPVDQRQRFTLTQLSALAADVLPMIQEGAAAHIKSKKAEPNASPIFKVNPKKALDYFVDKMLKQYEQQNVIHVLTYRLSGLKFNQQHACVQKAVALVREFFENPNETMFSLTEEKETLKEWNFHASVRVWNFGYLKMGFVQSDTPISWKEEDLAFFGLAHCDIDPTKINCIQYALLRAREPQAKHLIFAPPLEDHVTQGMGDQLEKWGYRRVDALDVGDLILYYANGKPSHMGYFIGNGLVESKLGFMNPYSHQHPIFGVTTIYGQYAVFYRKSGAKLF